LRDGLIVYAPTEGAEGKDITFQSIDILREGNLCVSLCSGVFSAFFPYVGHEQVGALFMKYSSEVASHRADSLDS
jgi:hypothetical protein